MKRLVDGVEVETFRARKPRPAKVPTIPIEELQKMLTAKGVTDVRIEARARVGRSEQITLRFSDDSTIRFTVQSARDPDGTRKAVIDFVNGLERITKHVIAVREEDFKKIGKDVNVSRAIPRRKRT